MTNLACVTSSIEVSRVPQKMRGDRRNNGYIMRMAEVVALFVKAPRSISELKDAMHLQPKHDSCNQYVKALRGEGLLYIMEYRRKGACHVAVYAWQPSVCFYPDARKQLVKPRRVS